MRARLTTYSRSIPLINAPLKDGQFYFKLSKVTQTYSLDAPSIIDIRTNALVFLLPKETLTPAVDQRVAREAFEELMPYIELSCCNPNCKHKHHLCTNALTCNYLGKKVDAWMIRAPKLRYEGFIDNKFVIHNDFTSNSTLIYSRKNEKADPIATSMLDWESMGKEKLLTRIKTLVTFS